MAFGLIVIGDEILSGKRRDQHFSKVVELLGERALQLAWAEYVGDDPVRLTALLARSFASDDIVFSCGGIGATPDDHTRQCAAAALGRPLALHPEAARYIDEFVAERARAAGQVADLGTREHLQRLKMAEFPAGATLIPNPYNRVAGFTVAHHHFVPGFPVMAWPMMAWVLDTHYGHLCHQVARAERAVIVYEMAESALTPLMAAIEAAQPLVKVFSLPSVGDGQTRRHIELGVKGDPAQVDAAYEQMCTGLDAVGADYRPL
jgi:molybdopterin-biosynthesis enzyme MoeA-like protein